MNYIIKKYIKKINLLELAIILAMTFFWITTNIFDYFESNLVIVPYILFPVLIVIMIINNILKRNLNYLYNNIFIISFFTLFMGNFSKHFSRGVGHIAFVGKILYIYVLPILLLVSIWMYIKTKSLKNLNPDDAPIFLISFGYFLILFYYHYH